MNYLVIKCGGSIFDSLPNSFFEDIVKLSKSNKWNPVIVHGGGPLINTLLEKFDITSDFVDGLRVTTPEMLDLVEMVLSGSVNKKVVRQIIKAQGNALGLSGVDGGLFNARLKDKRLGLVGEIISVNSGIIETLCMQGYIPVISPLAIDTNGQHYNINGDIAAAAMAKSLRAKLCLISDIPGIIVEKNNEKMILNKVTKTEVQSLLDDGTIYGGMIPKVTAALDGLMHQVSEVVILNGNQEHCLLDFCQGKNIGTKLLLDEEVHHV
ncbi:acetylglutamate kinase [Bacillus pakistanensis]|uniref:Acetylglutamate kinase n=1 Tax=Rossellomorea pakistanensis TaxID=992288 RepID=A0ABS2N825_9BACI|nr:acetylglutamate kinase [Bacillus pakistanensis]MBM7584011.1 acetylglutamate kinase [Bacillus pakistanensis]